MGVPTDDGDIHRLDDETVDRIAAGEVVERPASAVKELVENSLDADASRVTVAVESGGIDSIRVTDDGVGMSEDAVRRAVEKHTTSKITDISDLERGVGTLGFRGEALHAISAVARVTIRTRPRGGGRGTELTVEGGEVVDVSPAGCPTGTTVEVQDLFYNVPARRKYLSQDSTEFAHVNTVVTSYALANPDVAVTLEHDGRETFATNGTGDLQETVLSVYGREVAQAMHAIDGMDLPEGPLTDVSGLVSHPETNRASREYLTTLVNGRYVRADTVRDAVVDAYDTQLAPDRYPFAVVNLAVDPSTVDVNVHPRKYEIRFADEEGIRTQIRAAVEGTLLDAGIVRSSAPRGRSAPEQTKIDPESGDDGCGRAESADTPSGTETGTDDVSDASVSADGSAKSGHSEPTATADDPVPGETTARASADGVEPRETSARVADGATAESNHAATTPEPSAGGGDQSRSSSESRRKFTDAGQQQRLESGTDDPTFESLPSMRILGQFRETYVVAETESGLVLIDQHAADERVNYERLRESFAGETTMQTLAEPVRLDLTAREAALFDAHDEALARLGFRAERVDERTVVVRTVPELVAETAGPDLLRDVLGEFAAGGVDPSETVDAAVDELLGDLACYPSVTGNTSLTEGSVVDLLTALDECENPYACPHGRPVIVEFDTDEIEARFERDYPGHQ